MMTLWRWLRRLLWCYAGYAALVVVVVMPLANGLLPGVVREQTGRELQFDLLSINPLTLGVTLYNAALQDPDGGEFLSFDKLSVNVSLLQSLALRHFVLDALELRQLNVQVRRDTGAAAGEGFNFDDILAHRRALADAEPVAETEPEAAELPALTVRLMVFSAGHLGYMEQRPDGERFATALRDLALILKDFSTFREEGKPYRLAANDADGGQLLWEGDLSVAGAFSAGRLRLKNISLDPAYQYFASQLGLVMHSALFDMDLHYHLDWSSEHESPRLQLQDSGLTLHRVALQSRSDADTAIKLRRLAVQGLALDSFAQTVGVRSLMVEGLSLSGQSAGGEISLQPMFEMEIAAAPDENPSASEESPWQLELEQIELTDSRINWQAAELAVPLAILPRLQLRNLHWPATQAAQLEAQLNLNDTASLELQGQLHADGSELSMDGALQGLPLSWINPALAEVLRARLEDGVLSSAWRLTVADASLQRLELPSGGIAGLNLQTAPQQSADSSTLVAWKALAWTDVAIDLPARSLRIDALELDGPNGRLAIYTDGSTNINELMVATEPEAATGEQPEGAGPAGEEAAPEASGQESPWNAAIRSIAIRNGALDFSDASLALPFRVQIQQFQGQIDGLDSHADTPAKVDLNGRVDGYSPVSLLGTVQPLADPPALDLSFDFRSLDLTTLTPYSGTYAGYAIQQGLLSVTLSYELEDNRILGDNRVIIDQLQLGEAIESPRAIDLPLRLAIALLKDSRGVIDLGVRVSGDIDNPEFDLSKVIWAAFRNLLVKAVTAPFSLLAGLVNSDQPLDHIAFQPGSEQPEETAAAVMDKLIDALQQRPALRVALAGHVSQQDIQALAAAQLDASLQQQGIDQQAIDSRDDDWGAAIEKLYRQQFPDAETEHVDAMHQALLGKLAPSDEQLGALANQRALRVKEALVVERGLEPERVFLQRPANLLGARPAVELEAAPMG